MKDYRTHAKQFVGILVALGLLGIVACSDDGLDKRYPVSGTVTYNGKPLEKGSINFVPDAPEGRGALGEIKDGSYTLTTQSPGDGAFPGKYSVTITDLNVDLGAAEAATKELAAKKKVEMSSPMIDQAEAAKALKSAKNTVPGKYAQIDSSGLKAEVKAQSNTFDFALTD